MATRWPLLSRVALGLGIAALASSLFTLALIPDAGTLLLGKAAVGVAGLAFYFATHRGSIARFLSGRATFFHVSSGVLTVLVLLLLATLNYLARRADKTWDLTQNRIFTLSEDTLRVLRGLDGEVKLQAFFAARDQDYARARDLLERYRRETPRLSFVLLDPNQEPDLVKEKGIQKDGPRLLVTQGRAEARAAEPSEEELTRALLQVTRGDRYRVLFLTGHGEGDLADADSEQGYGDIARKLEGEGVEVESLSLAADEIPQDVRGLLLLGPRKPLLPGEIAALRNYLVRGGGLFVGFEPGVRDEALEALLGEHGIQVGAGLIVDPRSRMAGGSAAIPVVESYGEHEITDGFRTVTLFPTARPIALRDAGPHARVLASTSSASWAESDPREGEVKRDEGEAQGPLPVMVATWRAAESGSTRVVVAGDADFVRNKFAQAAGNADLFLNAVNWTLAQEARITIRPKLREASNLVVTEGGARFLNFFSLDVIPVLLLGIGLAVWLVRRGQ